MSNAALITILIAVSNARPSSSPRGTSMTCTMIRPWRTRIAFDAGLLREGERDSGLHPSGDYRRSFALHVLPSGNLATVTFLSGPGSKRESGGGEDGARCLIGGTAAGSRGRASQLASQQSQHALLQAHEAPAGRGASG